MAAAKTSKLSLLEPTIVRQAAIDSLKKLDPRLVAKNPVMFVVEVGSVLTTALWLRDRILHPAGAAPGWFTFIGSVWLWFTVVFAIFAEAVAEGRSIVVLAKERYGLRGREVNHGEHTFIPFTAQTRMTR